jgi:hypothetical protein
MASDGAGSCFTEDTWLDVVGGECYFQLTRLHELTDSYLRHELKYASTECLDILRQILVSKEAALMDVCTHLFKIRIFHEKSLLRRQFFFLQHIYKRINLSDCTHVISWMYSLHVSCEESFSIFF